MKTTQDAIDQDQVFHENLVRIIGFLAWAREEDELYGGISAKEALESLAFMLGWSVSEMDRVAENVIDDFYKS